MKNDKYEGGLRATFWLAVIYPEEKMEGQIMEKADMLKDDVVIANPEHKGCGGGGKRRRGRPKKYPWS